jgi:hypothetical protein
MLHAMTEQLRVLVASPKGGTGKTTTAVALAEHWAAAIGHAWLIDTDSQDAMSATWLLDRAAKADRLPAGLDYSKATPAQAFNQLRYPLPILAACPVVIVDSSPRLGDETLRQLAQLCHVTLVTGSLWEGATIVQGVRTFREAGALDVRPVITRADRRDIESPDGRRLVAWIEAEAGPILGHVEGSKVIARGAMLGQLPGAVRARERRRVLASVGRLARKIGGGHGQA